MNNNILNEIIKLYPYEDDLYISVKYHVPLSTIKQLSTKYKLSKKSTYKTTIILSPLQRQLLLGGKLGDGNFKINGRQYYYREKHAEDELGYLQWKSLVFHNILAKRGIYPVKMNLSNQQQAYEFSTITSASFTPYAKMSYMEAISEMDLFGLLVFMLDDGWYSPHSKKGNFIISGGLLTIEELNSICSQFDKNGIKGVHVIGHKRYDLSIPAENNKKLYKMASYLIPKNTDIMRKKFYNAKKF